MQTTQVPLDVLSHLVKWTPIALEIQKPDCKFRSWVEHDDSPISLEMARYLREQGLLLMAQRKTAGKWEVVIKAPMPVAVKIVKKKINRVDKRVR